MTHPEDIRVQLWEDLRDTPRNLMNFGVWTDVGAKVAENMGNTVWNIGWLDLKGAVEIEEKIGIWNFLEDWKL